MNEMPADFDLRPAIEEWDEPVGMILRCDECGEERRTDGATIVGEIHEEGACPRRGAFRLVPAEASCYECGLPYADFPDLVVPHDVWLKISPSGGECGLLCPTCMCGRAEAAGLTNVPARFTSGPFCLDDPAGFDEGVWRQRALAAEADRDSHQRAAISAGLALLKYGQHLDGCPFPPLCTCGFTSAVLRGLHEAIPATEEFS